MMSMAGIMRVVRMDEYGRNEEGDEDDENSGDDECDGDDKYGGENEGGRDDEGTGMMSMVKVDWCGGHRGAWWD